MSTTKKYYYNVGLNCINEAFFLSLCLSRRYEPVHAKVERHFQKQSIIREDPQAYANRFGEQLHDPATVIEQARAVGVLEDLVK